MAGRTRTVLVLAVLAGLFLMHGMTAAEAGGCHGSMAMAAEQASAHAMPSPSEAMMSPLSRALRAAEAEPARAGEHAAVTESCVPLRPEGLAGLFVALLLIVIMLWRPGRAAFADANHPHWPHGPPRPGAALLIAFGVSRT